MKKTLQVLRSLLLSGMFLFIGNGAYANHISAMDLSYAFVNSTGSGATLSSQYLVTVTIFGNCSDNTGAFPTLATSSPQVCVYNGATLVNTLNLVIQTPTAGINVTNVCAADTGLTTCTSLTDTIDGNKKFVYTATVTLTGTSAVFRFIYNGYNGTGGTAAGRSNRLTTINAPASSVVRLIDTLNNTAGPNTSTTLPIIPTPYYCEGDPDNYNPGATNAADSLVFQLVTPLTGPGTNGCTATAGMAVTYVAGSGVTTADPIQGSSAFSFSSTNGQIAFTTTTMQTTLVDYNIREFRSGVLVGTCMREMNIAVKPCSTPAPTGTVRSPTNGAVTSDSTTFETCLNSGVFSFNIVGQEPDTSYDITMTASNIPSGATYSIANNNTNHPVATFTWTATGVPSGTYAFDILYASNSCPVTSTGTIAYNVIIEPNPAAIVGTKTACTGETTSLTDSLTGGSWISSNTAIATAGTSGIVSGVSAGIDTITYTYSAAACKATTPVTVTGPAAIAGTTFTVCPALAISLTETTTGGTWSSSSTAVATVGTTTGVATTGVVTGVASGTANITYTLASTGCFVVKQVTVQAMAGITPTTNAVVCIGNTITLADATTGGVWSSSSTALATVSSGGLVGGVGAGSVTIFYTQSTGTCYASKVVSVSATGPGPISPSSAVSVCIGGTVQMADASTGGTWASSSTNATINSTSGLVTGVTAGAATISYFLGGCYVTQPITIISGIAAIGPATVPTICIDNTTTLTESTTGGTWTSGTTGVATLAVAGTTAVVTGVAAGTSLISYSIGTCMVTKIVTVAAGPQPITAPTTPFEICQGTTGTLTETTTGGTWSSNATTIASVTSGGVVTGSLLGTATISYTASGCAATIAVSVVAAPVALLPTSALICTGNTATFTESVTGGVWSSSSTGTASVTAGVVTGIAAGTATISYASGTCIVTAPVTVNLAPNPGLITGPSTVCVGGTAALTDAATGGVWSSNTTAVATVTALGSVSGVSAGTSLISYSVTSSCGTVRTTHEVTVSASPSAGAITGATNVCSGTTSPLADLVTGGTWMASNTHASINAVSGLVTGSSPGRDTVTYTITSSCGTVSTTVAVTVGASLSAGTITGTVTSICSGATTTLADATTGGTWGATNSSATINSAGLVTGSAGGGVDTMTYTVTASCGSAIASYVLTVNAVPVAAPISGSAVMCVGSAVTFTDATTGGVWSSANTNATVNSSSGLVTGVALGSDNISYTVTNSCGTSIVAFPITVSSTVSAGTISGGSSLCIGSTLTLTDAAGSGAWSATNSSASVVGGVVTGLANGVDTILYTVSAACGAAVATHVVTVTSTVLTAGTIVGPTSVCTSSLISLTDAAGGGAWSSSNSHATITVGGLVTGITPGLDTISYTITSTCGIASTSEVISVVTLTGTGSISGSSTVCIGTTTTLTDLTTGGVWSALNTNATINPTTGVVTGEAAGTDVITYTATTACGVISTTFGMTVGTSATAGTIAGPDVVCLGSSITLTDGVGGGVWSSGNTNVSVSGGIVTGMAVGTSPVSYTVSGACGTAFAVSLISVVPAPVSGVISGPGSICTGSPVTLVDAAPGGTWVASNGHATVVSPGVINGVSIGVDTIFYVVSNACGTSTASKIVVVNPSPSSDPIVGPTTQCTGTFILLLDASSGGTWSSSNSAIATVNPTTGVIIGVGAGIATMTYTVTNVYGCPANIISLDTVTASPGLTPITGSSTACIGSTVTLGNATTGGVWTSGTTAIATINPATGVLTGLNTGTVIITYTVVNSCGTAFIVSTETINPPPVVDPIAGSTVTCVGSSITLTDGTIGGVWSSSNTALATVVPGTGVVTGIVAGSVNINYTYTGSCPLTVSALVTINSAPFVAAITGTASECIGTTTLLSDGTFGGAWSSSNTAVANVSGGLVSGVTPGTAVIFYTISAGVGCTGTASVINTVLAIPTGAPITGVISPICAGVDVHLSNTAPDGSWSSGNTAIAEVNALTGVVTGLTSGTDEIYYTISNICGAARDSAAMVITSAPTVSPIVAAYTTLCSGTTVNLTDGSAGGHWSSSNTLIAEVNSTSGLVTGVSSGTDTVYYTVSAAGGCSGSAAVTIYISGSIASAGITPSGSVTLCHGHTIFMNVVPALGAGTTYQWLLNGGPIAGATGASYTATSIGVYSAAVNNGTCSETIHGPTVVSPPNPVISFSLPNKLSTTSFPSYQWYLNGSPIAGANGNSVTITASGTYKVVVTDFNGCSDTSGGYVVTGHTVNGVNSVTNTDEVKVYPNPATSTVHIDAPMAVNVTVVSIDGKVLISKQNVTTIDVSALSDGMYMIMVYDENNLLLKATKFAKVE